MVDIQVLNALDEALIDSARDVKPLYYAEPINGEEQKKEFLSGNILNPKFLYKGLEYDPKDVTRKLTEIEVPDDELGKIFQKKKRNVLPLILPMIFIMIIALISLLLNAKEFMLVNNTLLLSIDVILILLIIWMMIEGLLYVKRKVKF